MNKQEFIAHLATQHSCTKVKAEKAIGMFTSSVIDAMSEGKEIFLKDFGSFYINQVAAKKGINPRTKEPVEIAAYKQVKFRVGKMLKDAVNK